MTAFERAPKSHDRRAARYEALLLQARRRISTIAGLRLASFLVGAVGIGGVLSGDASVVYRVLGAVGVVAYGVFVWLHRAPFAAVPRLEALRDIAREGAARLRQEWDVLGPRADSTALLDHAAPMLGELQVFGRGPSLMALLDRTSLPLSRAHLAALLRHGMGPDDIAAVQEAARELAPATAFRHRLAAEGRLVSFDAPKMDAFLGWAEGREPAVAAWLVRAAGLATVLVPLTLGLAVFTAVTEIHTPWKLLFGAQVVLYAVTGWSVQGLTQPLLAGEQHLPFVGLRRMFERVERRRFRTARLAEIRTTLGTGADSPARRLEILERAVEALAVRYNVLFALALNLILLWELRHTARLIKWQRANGGRIRADLERLSEIEVVASIAGFAHDNPGACWPAVRDGAPALEGVALGHPLIPSATRRTNDFTLDRGGRLVFITGSNMSGKSSFLRTVGANVLLARAGAPCFAESLALTPCEPATSIQVTDAPEQGWSLFYAEVKRIRGILDAVEAAESDPDMPPRLYLVDEMLRGTNSRERNIASLSIVRQLLGARRSFGMVTTHDLSLVRLAEEFPDDVEARHFSDHFDGEKLNFDYQLKDGVATTTNALRVLQMEGIEVPVEDSAG